MSWVKLSTVRGNLLRMGNTFGKGLNTVKAVRFIVNQEVLSGVPTVETRFDHMTITGGPITGQVEYCYIYVYDNGSYQAKSAPSPILSNIILLSQGAVIRIPADASRDTQVNKIWLYRRGRGLDQFYRVATADVAGTGTVDINDTTSDEDVLVANLPLMDGGSIPPDNIIGIEGPYYDRLFVLTATHLYPSRRLNPDSFAASQVIQVAGADETALWVKKAIGGLYVGTTKDIYWISGDGAELPDGTVNFDKKPLNIDNPPRSAAVAQEGNLLCYLAADGWRGISGGGSQLFVGETSLLYRGKARHGVSAINMVGGRFRAAIAQGQLAAITPEGAEENSATKLYRYRFESKRWYRDVYSSQWRSIYREPDGTLIAGDVAGFVWRLDEGSQDAGANIPIIFWTGEDDHGHPFSRKDPYDFRAMVNTGGQDATIQIHPDSSANPTGIGVANNATLLESLFTMSAVAAFHRAQIRVSGSFSTFLWAGHHLGVHPLPIMVRGHVPPFMFEHSGIKVCGGIEMRVCTLGATRTFTPVVDNVDQSTFQVTSYTDEPKDVTHQFTTPVPVTDLWFKVDGDIEVYWWKPIVLYELPPRLKIWENKPLRRSPVRRRFGGIVMQINTHGVAASLIPVVDGVDQASIPFTTNDLQAQVKTINAVVGRDLWCRMSETTPFTVVAVEPIIINEHPQIMKGETARMDVNYPGLKSVSGIQLKVCTLGQTITVTPMVDGVAQPTFQVTSSLDNPIDITHGFVGVVQGVEFSLSFSGDVEIYSWAPLVAAKRPLGIKTWDSGPLDLGRRKELIWPREVWIKAELGADVDIDCQFDGKSYGHVTAVCDNAGVTSRIRIPIPRGYKGRVPRFVFTSTAPFFPYWFEFVIRETGEETEKMPIRVPANLGGEIPA